jgi:pseudo-response regulator 5
MDEEIELNGIMNETEVKEEKMNDHDNVDDQSKEVFRWEMLLPKINVTVLLVESDRATRRLITAILKNCSYIVIAVSNGLKAWETLKTKATDIDLILTEMELPAISGLELLSKIMEHEICKNIPVIMMSSHDSRITAMNCMFKGAADFLIKPVRKNELTNLWQHVWRKLVINRPLQNIRSAQKNLKIATEDNFAGNQSTDSDSVASSQKNDKCSEKLSEDQSTCALPFSDAENAYMDNMQNASLMKCSLKLSNIDVLKHEESNISVRGSTKPNDETEDPRLEQDLSTAEIEPKNEILRAELSRENPDVDTEIRRCSDEPIEP